MVVQPISTNLPLMHQRRPVATEVDLVAYTVSPLDDGLDYAVFKFPVVQIHLDPVTESDGLIGSLSRHC